MNFYMHKTHETANRPRVSQIAKNLPQEYRRPTGRISRGSPKTSHFLPEECRKNVKCPKEIPPTSFRGTSSWECRRNSKGRLNRNEKFSKLPNYFH